MARGRGARAGVGLEARLVGLEGGAVGLEVDDDGASRAVPADGRADAGLGLEGEVLCQQHVPLQGDGALLCAGAGRFRSAAPGGELGGTRLSWSALNWRSGRGVGL